MTFLPAKDKLYKIEAVKTTHGSLTALYFSGSESNPARQTVFYWAPVNSLQILPIQKMKSGMCSLASEQHKGAATLYKVSYRWGNMYFLLITGGFLYVW